MRDGGCGRVFPVCCDPHRHVVRAQDFERGGKRGFRQSVGVDSEEERSVYAVLFPINANRLRDGQDMPLVERVIQCGTSMTGGAEGHPLRRNARVGTVGIVRRHQTRRVDEIRGLGRLASHGTNRHEFSLVGRTGGPPCRIVCVYCH